MISILGLSAMACNGGGKQEQVEDVQVADNPDTQANEQNDHRTQTRQRQYFLQGEKLYKSYCTACHGAEGKGLGTLYPPLKDSDFLDGNESTIACGIKYGMTGPLTVNGKEYNQPMVGLTQLTNLQIAEIMTYVYASMGTNEDAFVEVKEVDEYLKNCDSMVQFGNE